MIGRVQLTTRATEMQPIEAAAVREIDGEHNAASGPSEEVIHCTSLLGELHWAGTMNAFRVATAFDAVQSQLESLKDRETLSEQKLSANLQAGMPQVAPQPIELSSVQPVVGLDQEQNTTTGLRRDTPEQNPGESVEHGVSFATAESVVYIPHDRSKPRLKNRENINQILDTGERRTIFRGRLVRIGHTSQFVERSLT